MMDLLVKLMRIRRNSSSAHWTSLNLESSLRNYEPTEEPFNIHFVPKEVKSQSLAEKKLLVEKQLVWVLLLVVRRPLLMHTRRCCPLFQSFHILESFSRVLLLWSLRKLKQNILSMLLSIFSMGMLCSSLTAQTLSRSSFWKMYDYITSADHSAFILKTIPCVCT
ncbi:hypothetical protein MKW92_028994 [Papaver armeniacum]|nr:hypothetical protein MKW92_028994 [Papaver armeniacum]